MTNRRQTYLRLREACESQTTAWLMRCHAEPGAYQNATSRLAVRDTLRARGAIN